MANITITFDRALDVSAPVITAALQHQLRSRESEPFSDKMLAALRFQFGGHGVK